MPKIARVEQPDPTLDAIQRFLEIWAEESALAEVEDAISLVWRNQSNGTIDVPAAAKLQAPTVLKEESIAPMDGRDRSKGRSMRRS